MGTRADFYIGRGPEAEWLASIAWDGYPAGIDAKVLKAKSVKAFKNALEKFFVERDDVTRPKDGWPWPWNDSCTTDYAYAFDEGKGKVYAACFGHKWFCCNPLREPKDNGSPSKQCIFPDMTQVQNTTFGKRSGLLIIQG